MEVDSTTSQEKDLLQPESPPFLVEIIFIQDYKEL